MKNLLLLLLFFTSILYAQNWEKIDSVFAPGGVTVQAFTAPVFGDLDDDGDFDLVLGSTGLEIEYFENTGTNTVPVFHKDASMFSSIYEGGYQYTNSYYPALYDLDNDGDLDLTIGGYNGILYYENTGTPSVPVWADVNTDLFSDANSQIGTDARETFSDLDNDGDLDLIVGIGESLLGGPTPGITMGFRNTGTAQAPAFLRDDSLVTGIPDVGLNSYPTLADLDNDGDNDMLIGRDGAAVFYYENTGTSTAPIWTRDYTVFSIVETINYWKDPGFWDLDGDNDFDLIYGTDNGDLFFYENTGTISAPQYQYNPAYFKVIKSSGSSTVSFADYDNDGDYDMLSGSTYSGLLYVQNNGNNTTPSFDTASVIFAGIDPGFRCSPVFIDIDNDSDFDIVSGYSGGTIKLYVNNNGIFTENTTMFANVSVNYQSIPAFVDIDGDNDQDLLSVPKMQAIRNFI
ncbi:MAG TPA: VCBS repeat-containing protein [Ignavibacteriaceae bacterium]